MSDSPSEPPVKTQRSTDRGNAGWYRATSASSVGIEIAVAISMCTLLGRWVQNEYTHWAPWTMLIGFGIGCGAAIRAIQRALKDYQRELNDPTPTGPDARPQLPPTAMGGLARWVEKQMTRPAQTPADHDGKMSTDNPPTANKRPVDEKPEMKSQEPPQDPS